MKNVITNHTAIVIARNSKVFQIFGLPQLFLMDQNTYSTLTNWCQEEIAAILQKLCKH